MQLFNQVGLVLNFIGVCGLFYFGLPSPVKDNSKSAGGFSFGDKSQSEIDKINSDNARIKCIAKISFALILIGIALQIISTF